MGNLPKLSKATAFVDALVADDDLIAVIRGHLYVEAELDRYIKNQLPKGEFMKARLNWPQRIDLALALGLDENFGSPLRELNRIRNKFAHDPENTKIEDADGRGLVEEKNGLGIDPVVEHGYEQLFADAGETPPVPFEKSGARGRFALAVNSIYKFIRILNHIEEWNPDESDDAE